MLVPIKSSELWRIIPAVATGSQFAKCTGNGQKILQRVLIAVIGGVVSLLISQNQLSTLWGPLWLIISFVFFLYLLWGPIIEAGRLNSQLRKYSTAAIFEGRIKNLYTREQVEARREQANTDGILELVENRRTWLCLELEDSDGYLAEIRFPLNKKHHILYRGAIVYCLILSHNKDFSSIDAISDIWLPKLSLWVGAYPYLLRPAFEELCRRRIKTL
uniref:Uncharacterized protein n=1 Tax=Paulinella chromatophora TaxID=39717 RepID=B1X5K0_PAUCH|nr:hypothetical protein PCC_0805 [Paulinella chromatophora]ACB43219.1 hypothetical protein PCC_0805 [Paulinella chromatophora]